LPFSFGFVFTLVFGRSSHPVDTTNAKMTARIEKTGFAFTQITSLFGDVFSRKGESDRLCDGKQFVHVDDPDGPGIFGGPDYDVCRTGRMDVAGPVYFEFFAGFDSVEASGVDERALGGLAEDPCLARPPVSFPDDPFRQRSKLVIRDICQDEIG